MKDGGAAFPVFEARSCGAEYHSAEPGMTLRDWFAGQVLAGLYAGEGLRHEPKWYVEEAYKAADVALAEREVQKNASVQAENKNTQCDGCDYIKEQPVNIKELTDYLAWLQEKFGVMGDADVKIEMSAVHTSQICVEDLRSGVIFDMRPDDGYFWITEGEDCWSINDDYKTTKAKDLQCLLNEQGKFYQFYADKINKWGNK